MNAVRQVTGWSASEWGFTGRGLLTAAVTMLVACGEPSDQVPNHEGLASYIRNHQVGADTDYWIEMRNLSGEWERVGLMFGYVGDEDECLKAIAGLKKVNYDRDYRCVAANRKG